MEQINRTNATEKSKENGEMMHTDEHLVCEVARRWGDEICAG
jgi:hypothetical protein